MKIYNPFSAHIAETKDYYYIRKFSIFGWIFLSKYEPENYWFYFPEHIDKFCRFDCKKDAIKRLKKYKTSIKKPKAKYTESL